MSPAHVPCPVRGSIAALPGPEGAVQPQLPASQAAPPLPFAVLERRRAQQAFEAELQRAAQVRQGRSCLIAAMLSYCQVASCPLAHCQLARCSLHKYGLDHRQL
jgi:hypothetical protein